MKKYKESWPLVFSLQFLHPVVFIARRNGMTNLLNASERVFGWDRRHLAFAIRTTLDPKSSPVNPGDTTEK